MDIAIKIRTAAIQGQNRIFLSNGSDIFFGLFQILFVYDGLLCTGQAPNDHLHGCEEYIAAVEDAVCAN